MEIQFLDMLVHECKQAIEKMIQNYRNAVQ